MRDVREIIQFWQERSTSVLVTLVGIEGSSYRQLGANLLLGTEGEWAGTISGGCLESTVVRKARWNVRDGAVVERFSTLFDDVSEMPFGSGCGGVVDLLMEPTDTPECRALMSAMDAALSGVESTVLTWLPNQTQRLKRAILGPKGQVLFRTSNLTDIALKSASNGSSIGSSMVAPTVASGRSNTQSGGLFTKHLIAPQRLFIVGAGDDARPLSSIASLLGWSVIVMDRRAHLARRDRFPHAAQVEAISSPSLAARQIGQSDAVVLMTHSFEQDRELLATILPQRPKYLGLLGAKTRSSLLVSEVAKMLGRSVLECCDRIHAPIGLDLGGDGPEAISLAIVAEIQACCMGKLPSSRKLSPLDVERCASFPQRVNHDAARCALDVA